MTATTIRRWCLAWLLTPMVAGAADGGTVPRYDLKPGQVLTYEEDQTFEGRGFESRVRITRRFWILGRNDDGSWRIFAREVIGNSRVPFEMTDHARFDLRPDGEVTGRATLAEKIHPAHAFPRLPRDDRELASGWDGANDRDEETIRSRVADRPAVADPRSFDFETIWDSAAHRAQGGEERRSFRFDRERGLVVGAEVVQSVSARVRGKGPGTFKLGSVEWLEPAKRAVLRAEVDRCFAAAEAYLALCHRAETSAADAEGLLKRARSALMELRASVTLPETVALADDQIASHDRQAEALIERAGRFARLIGRPAPAWAIEDLDGVTHTLEAYRGRVLVLDFWYRGCGWCMQAMPQVKRLAADYQGRPVAVLGLSNDKDVADARFVARKMELAYPVLHSEELPGRYGVQAFPTLIIIDPAGMIAEVHVGYSAHLYEDVKEIVDRLLGPK